MRDIPTLDKTLLNSEFELARALYEQMRGQGYAPLKAAAMVYRHGYLDGRDSNKQFVREYHKQKHAAQHAEQSRQAEQLIQTDSQPEATTEGSETND